MKNEVAYKNQNVYLKINIYLNQASTLRFRPVRPVPLYTNHFRMLLTTFIFWNSTVAHYNPHINVIFVYLFMQKLFVDKIHFFKFLSMSANHDYTS